MRLADLLPSFQDELEKLAAYSGEPTAAELKADAHHQSGTKDWKAFEKNLRSKTFKGAVLTHPDSDDKLKQYVTSYGGYLASKDVLGTVPSRTSKKKYKIKKLPDGKTLGCGCGDWQYKHSIKGTDCAHIKAFRNLQSMSSQVKQASLMTMARGATASHRIWTSKKLKNRGSIMEENVRRLKEGKPLIEVGHEG